MQQNKGFDKRQMINFFIFSLILIGAMFYFQNRQIDEETKANQTKVEKLASTPTTSVAATESIQNFNLKNEELNLEFSNKGGLLTKVELLKYKAYNTKDDVANLPLELISNNSASYGFEFQDASGKVLNTKDLIFTPQVKGNEITFTAQQNGGVIQMIYTLLPKYKVDFKVKTQGLSQIIKADKTKFVWDYQVKKLEKGRSQEQSHSEFAYAFDNYKKYDYDGRTDMDETGETLNWIGVKQQFFASVIEAKNGFSQSVGHQDMIEEGDYLKKLNYSAELAVSGGEFNQDFTWYFLPLDLPLLKSYDKNFDEILPLGWSFIGTLNRVFFMPVYNFIASWGISAGWVIFILTIIVKLILSPITFKQHKLSAMMRVIRPEIEEVNEKHKNADPMKKQQAIMEVYRKAGVNQLAGCLPGLLQIPIFYALFRFFPNFIDLRGQSFWFAKDLTAYDDLIKLPFHIPLLGSILVFLLFFVRRWCLSIL